MDYFSGGRIRLFYWTVLFAVYGLAFLSAISSKMWIIYTGNHRSSCNFDRSAQASIGFGLKWYRSSPKSEPDKRMRIHFLLILLTAANVQAADERALTPGAPSVLMKSGVAVTDIDNAAKPTDDFFNYANGAWHKRNPIPGDRSSWGPTAQLAAEMRARMRLLIESAEGNTDSPDARNIASFFASAMDERRIEALGASPLSKELATIAGLRNKRELASYLAHLGAIGASSPLELGVDLDVKNARRYVPQLGQGELGMIDRSYYLEQAAAQLTVRTQYLHFLTTGFTLLDDSQASEHAADVVAFETALAQAQWSATDTNDPLKTSSSVRVDAMARLAPGFDWNAYLNAAGLPETQRDLVLNHPSYLKKFAQLFADTPLVTWKHYLKGQLLGSYASTLSSPFANASHAFYNTTLRGKVTRSSRWESSVAWTESSLGSPLGKLYVQRYFPPAHLARARQLVDNVKAEFRISIGQISWMSAATKNEALAKLETMSVNVGLPTVWPDYSGLVIKRDDLVGNLMRARQFKRQYEMSLLGKPVVRANWLLLPQAVSANYHHGLNAITIPAGRLQPPYFDVDADDAVNYGGIASVIGHEISHAFDNYGGQFDSHGRLRNWWSAADRANFTARGQRMVEQYGRYSPMPGRHVDGTLTLSENIADNLGLAVALRAYHRSLQGKDGPVLDGYTADQRFFLGYARSRSKVLRDQLMIATLKRDEHAPDEVRVNGAVRNMDAFHAAFGTVDGDPMYLAPSDRISVW